MTDQVQFSDDDALLVVQVAHRWKGLLAQHGEDVDVLSARMDLAAANGVNGNAPLDLGALMDFDDSNFAHDMAGIERHMDRETGRLGGFFLPRCAKPEVAV